MPIIATNNNVAQLTFGVAVNGLYRFFATHADST